MPPRLLHNIAFGRALREVRRGRKPKLSQDQLATTAGLDRTFISLLEAGDRSPTLNTVFAICTALETSPMYFMQRTLEIIDSLKDEITAAKGDKPEGADAPTETPASPVVDD